MTLILSFACRDYALHVSDRQITTRRSGSPDQIHSPVENKTIILVCRDAVGVLGYTGSAYVNDTPTDQWIAQQLVRTVENGPALGDFAYGGPGIGNISLNAVNERIRMGLSSAMLPRGARVLELSFAGFRIRRKYCVPFSLGLNWSAQGPRQASIGRRPLKRGEFIGAQAGDEFPTRAELWKYVEDGAAASGASTGDERLRQGFMSAIRERASQTTTVGKDLMTVLIPNPNIDRVITWSFEPQADHRAQLRGTDGSGQVFSAVYSPWILTPGSVCAPCVGTGGMTISASGWTIQPRSDPKQESANPQSGARILFASSSQRRLRPPR